MRQVKQAEADETSSKHRAVEMTVIAQAELEAAGKHSEAKKRMAEGIEAERAAPGLADARVREVTAAALEKEGMVKARVVAETMAAEAKGTQDKGMAQAKVLEENLGAQARGEEQLGTAQAKVTKDRGLSEAEVLREKYRSEAEGLTEKFTALSSLSDQARAHEEFRMQLEKSFEQAIASIAANKDIAREQAEVLSAALSKANIDIVGGEGAFFDSFAKALSVGKAVEGFAGKSPVVQEVLQKLLSLGGKDAPSKAAAVQAEDA